MTTLLPFDIFSLEVDTAVPQTYIIDAQMQSQITESGSAPITITVTMPDSQGGFVPVPDLVVQLTATCGSVSPSNSTTSAQGTVTATVTPDSGCTSVSVTIEVFTDASSSPVATQVVTATVSSSVISRLLIGATGGKIEAYLVNVGEGIGFPTFSSPISDTAGFVSQLNTALSGITEIGYFNVTLYEPVNLSLSLGIPVGEVHVYSYDSSIVGSGCGSTVNVAVGNVRSNNSATKSDSTGDASIGGCLTHGTLSVGDVENSLGISGSNSDIQVTAGKVGKGVGIGPWYGTSQSLTVSVSAGAIGSLQILNTLDSTVNVQGIIEKQPPQLVASIYIQSNSNLTLGPITGNDLNNVDIQNNSFNTWPSISIGNVLHPGGNITSPKGDVIIHINSGLSINDLNMGNQINGDLKIMHNKGFSDTEATNFATFKTIGGVTSIGYNSP